MNHSIQITVLDYYIGAPLPGLDILYSDFRASPVNQVPILRCFGSTENGTKICVHIHGVFPYFYIPYNGQDNPEDLMQKISREIDKTINLSLNQANSNIQHVYKISLVSGIPMYGYHVKKHQFLKIYLYNPKLVSKIGNLLLNGQILDQIFQPHEIHLNFTLQFMIDYNLHGMNAMLIKNLQFRKDQHNLLINNVDDDDNNMRNFLTLEKQSYCEFEADVNAENILNLAEISSGNLTVNPGIAALWEDEKQRRRNQNKNSQLGDFLEMNNLETVPTKSHIIFKQALNERLLLAAASMDEDTSTVEQNSSIYPAESPKELNIQNASLLDIHCPSSLELSLDETLTKFYSQQQNSGGEDVTMDEDALKLVGLLEQLAEENALEENDGILSQTVVADEEEEDVDFDDLSLPLALLTTPMKNFPTDDASAVDDEDILNTTLIPQIDGLNDSSDEDDDDDVPLINLQQKMLCEPFTVELVLMDLPYTQYSQLNKRINKVIAENNKINNKMIKRATWRVKKLFSKYTIHKRIKRRKIKEKYLMDFLNHTKPKIGILHSRKNDFLVTHQRSTFEETILNYIIRLTDFYTDPDLYITIKIESDTYFWHYGGNSIPKVLPNYLKNKLNFGKLNELNSDLNFSSKAILLKKIHKILWLDDNFEFRNRKNINKNKLAVSKEEDDNNREINEQNSELHEFFDMETFDLSQLKTDNNLHEDKREKWASASLDMPEISINADADSPTTDDTISIQKENCSNVHSFAELTLNEQSMENVSKIRIDKNAWALLLALEQFSEENNIQDVNGNLSSSMAKIDQNKKNITLTSQLDGLNDFSDSDEDISFSTASKILLCEPFSIKIIQEDLRVLKIREQLKPLNTKTDIEMLRLATFRAKRLFNKYAIDEFVNRRKSKDLILMNYLNHSKPKLGCFSSTRDFLVPNPHSFRFEETIINFMIRITKFYVAPNLYIIIETGSKTYFYDYGGNYIAKTTEITNFSNYKDLKMFKHLKGKKCKAGISQKEKLLSKIQNNIFRLDKIPKRRNRRRSVRTPKLFKNELSRDESPLIKVDPSFPPLNDFTHNFTDYCETIYDNNTQYSDKVELFPVFTLYSNLIEELHESRNILQDHLKFLKEINFLIRDSSSSSSFNNIMSPNKNYNSSFSLKGLDYNKPYYFNCDGIMDTSSDDDDDDEEKNSSLTLSGLGLNVDTLSENNQEKQPELNKLVSKPHKRKLFICDNDVTKESLNLGSSSRFSAKNDELERSSDSDLFSSSDNEMLVFKSPQHLSTSRIYDNMNNYYPTQGCSKQDVNLIVKIKPVNKDPTKFQVEFTMSKYKIPKIIQQEPFYGNVEDYTGTVEVGQRIMRIGTRTTAHLQEFQSQIKGIEDYRKDFIKTESNLSWNINNLKHLELAYCPNKTVVICPLKKAPTRNEVLKWIKSSPGTITEENISPKKKLITIHIPNSPDESDLSETSLTLTPCVIPHHSDESNNKSCLISGISHGNTFGFDNSVQNLQAARAVSGQYHLTSMVMELHIRTRGDLRPNPLFDSICAVFYSILYETNIIKGVIAINTLPSDAGHQRNDFFNGLGRINMDITYVSNEENLINSLILIIRKWDPDILAGYEIEMLSWGYLIERASVLSINLTPLLGRWKNNKPNNNNKQQPQSRDLETSIIGRIVINVWRIMRHEIALQSYTLESIVYNILHRRIPFYEFKDLTFWWDHRTTLYRHRTVRYYAQRVEIILELFNKLDFLNRTSELAKLFGILFYEVLSRGSQFRVESMMLRLAKPLNYVPVSPDTKQRAQMKAPEFIPLVMEPESKFYTDPIIVLDFQSLYPSIIIAYNYCFTTCIGRVKNLGSNNRFEFGATQLKVPKRLVEKLYKKNLLNYSPCGVAFVKHKVREGILPRMLKEILGTRLMVKDSMKANKHDGNLQKVLHNRQLGLKLIANVTYGYTAANFSGRMCCVEVGDSVVSKGRETLQRAISMVENTAEWEAKVVYGDTDSLFVLVPGKSKEEAFEIGKKIAAAVTADNPDPVKLKLEKVYQPCILQTKKRYVGYKYESPEEQIPIYEAKGIETVRRDGCPAVSKMLLQCLTLLFDTRDISLVKNYVLKQFNKIQKGRVSIQDLTFAKEYRGNGGYKPGACVPALELARKWKLVDPRCEPRSGERVPYVIINGPPGLPLIRLVRSPKELLKNIALRPNALYYITKVIIPPLNRCFNLIGADLNNWFNQMPRIVQHHLPNSSPSLNPIRKTVISQYFVTRICAACSNQILDEGLCEKCRNKSNCTALTLTEKLKLWEENYFNTLLLCQSCSDDSGQQISCFSLDCPVLYRRTQTFNDLQQSAYVRDLLNSFNVFEDD